MTAIISACLVSALVNISPNDTCALLANSQLQSHVDLLAQGESEHFQVLVHSSEPIHNVHFAITSGASNVAIETSLVGYVYCKPTKAEPGSGGGWRPDPLMPLTSETAFSVAPNVAQSVWVRVTSLQHSPMDSFNLVMQVSGMAASQPISTIQTMPVTIHKITLPAVTDPHGFRTTFSFDDSRLIPFSGNIDAYHRYVTDRRIPPDLLYNRVPRTLADYKYLSENSNIFNLIYIGGELTHDSCLVNDSYVHYVLNDVVAPLVDKLTAANISLTNAYVYGFDEFPPNCEPGIRALFGAVRQRFGLKTMAPLDWPNMPLDLPLDYWVIQYQLYNASQVARWVATGKQYFFYHCIAPRGADYLNTFIEHPAIGDRLLFWTVLGKPVSGWLYYAVNLWQPYPGTRHHPIGFVNTTPPYTDFPPANYIWGLQYGSDYFANGDGQYLYPGFGGVPIGTTRLDRIQDGLEDIALVRLLPPGAQEKYYTQLVQGPQTWSKDPSLVQDVRRSVIAAVLGNL